MQGKEEASFGEISMSATRFAWLVRPGCQASTRINVQMSSSNAVVMKTRQGFNRSLTLFSDLDFGGVPNF